MLFKRKRKLVYGVFVVKDNREMLAGLYKDKRNAGQCAKVMRENTKWRTSIRSVGIDF